MFDDIEGLEEFKTDSVKPSSGYQSNNAGFKKFPKKAEVVTDIPYTPIAFFLDRDFPPEVKDRFYKYINKLISKNTVIRINGDDKDFILKLLELGYDKLEVYIAWKNFNDIESKFYYNTETSKMIAAKYNPGYEKLPDAVKALLARNARLLFGEKNNSCALSLITWSKDSAARLIDITRETGRATHVIRMALSNYISVLNINRENADIIFNKSFRLDE